MRWFDSLDRFTLVNQSTCFCLCLSRRLARLYGCDASKSVAQWNRHSTYLSLYFRFYGCLSSTKEQGREEEEEEEEEEENDNANSLCVCVCVCVALSLSTTGLIALDRMQCSSYIGWQLDVGAPRGQCAGTKSSAHLVSPLWRTYGSPQYSKTPSLSGDRPTYTEKKERGENHCNHHAPPPRLKQAEMKPEKSTMQ